MYSKTFLKKYAICILEGNFTIFLDDCLPFYTYNTANNVK
jgi:hypothetical protein